MQSEYEGGPESEEVQEWLLAFGSHLRELRLERNLTQERLAEIAGLHRVVIGKLERAERDVGISHILRLSQALGVTPGDLFDF